MVIALPAQDHPSNETDAEALARWLAQSARGDSAAFASFYDGTARRVFGLVLRVLRDRAQAEETTQEIYLQVWRLAGRYDPQRSAAIPWLLMLTHRRAVDRVRSAESEQRRDTADYRAAYQVEHDSTAEAVGIAMEAKRVRTALGQLPPVQREAIELAYFDARTGAEIAAITGAPEGTVKSRIRDGLLRLKLILGDAA